MNKLLLIPLFILFGCQLVSNKGNTMTMDVLLSRVRNQYLSNFQSVLTRQKTDKSATEVMLQLTADENRSQPEIFQLYRYDIISKNADGKLDLTEFNLDKDSIIEFGQQVYIINDMTVDIFPFVWNGCELNLDKNPGDAYVNWARKWIDIDDKKMRTPDGFQNVIHNVTFPKEENGNWTTFIDFGTSPIGAFKEL
ncbi:MAG TPA: hypothetical protein VFI33_17770, partial [Puia sp.]|nr:hypothetical protein [Puia sp.]